MVLVMFGEINLHSLMKQLLFAANFEQRLKDTFIQKCISDIESSNKGRMYREIKTVYNVKII